MTAERYIIFIGQKQLVVESFEKEKKRKKGQEESKGRRE